MVNGPLTDLQEQTATTNEKFHRCRWQTVDIYFANCHTMNCSRYPSILFNFAYSTVSRQSSSNEWQKKRRREIGRGREKTQVNELSHNHSR